MAPTDVDALWAEMQAEASAPAHKPTKKKVKKASKPASTGPASTSEKETSPSDIVPSVGDVRLDAKSLNRDINTIADTEASREERFISMQAIYRQILAATAKGADPTEGQAVWDLTLKPLCKRIYDEVEKIRILALECLIEGFVLTEEPLEATPYVLPVVIDRLVPGELFQFEPSEEARLRLIKLVRTLILLRPMPLMAEHSQEILTLVCSATKDTAPEVKKVALSCVRPITKTVAHYSIWKQETATVMAAVGLSLAHRHASVRLAGLDAIDALMELGGAAEPLQAVAGDQIRPQTWGDVFDENVKNNFLAMMIQDGNPAVRVEYYRLLGEWLSGLEDKMDHEHLLAPYLLSGLSDNSIAIREATILAIEKVGERYEKDNALEFREEIEYGLLKLEDQRFMKQGGALPPPMKGRPRLGSRVFVRSHAYRMIPCIIRELKEPLFTETVRLRSATLLRIILAYLEEHATKFTRNFVDAFMNTLHLIKDDPDPTLVSTLLSCGELLGRFVDINIYLPFIQLDTVLGTSNPAGSILLAAAILKGMPPTGVQENAMRFHELFVPDEICESNDYRVQQAVLSLLESIIGRYENPSKEEAVLLSHTMLHLEVGCLHHGEEAVEILRLAKNSLREKLGYEAAIYQQLVLNTVLRRFEQGLLSMMIPRSVQVLERAVTDAEVEHVEANVGCILRLLEHSVSGKSVPDQLTRALKVAQSLLEKLGSQDQRVTGLLTESMVYNSGFSEEALLVLLDCAKIIFEAEEKNQEALEVAKTIVRVALREDAAAVVRTEAESFVKRYPDAKDCVADESPGGVPVEVEGFKNHKQTVALEDYLDDCNISEPNEQGQEPTASEEDEASFLEELD